MPPFLYLHVLPEFFPVALLWVYFDDVYKMWKFLTTLNRNWFQQRRTSLWREQWMILEVFEKWVDVLTKRSWHPNIKILSRAIQKLYLWIRNFHLAETCNQSCEYDSTCHLILIIGLPELSEASLQCIEKKSSKHDEGFYLLREEYLKSGRNSLVHLIRE